jgi:hypothetical protein
MLRDELTQFCPTMDGSVTSVTSITSITSVTTIYLYIQGAPSRLLKLLEAPHVVSQLYGVPHGILQVCINISK